jgi:hypothetical protein
MEKSLPLSTFTNMNVIPNFDIRLKNTIQSTPVSQKKNDVSLNHFFTGAVAGAISRTAT